MTYLHHHHRHHHLHTQPLIQVCPVICQLTSVSICHLTDSAGFTESLLGSRSSLRALYVLLPSSRYTVVSGLKNLGCARRRDLLFDGGEREGVISVRTETETLSVSAVCNKCFYSVLGWKCSFSSYWMPLSFLTGLGSVRLFCAYDTRHVPSHHSLIIILWQYEIQACPKLTT